MGIMNKMRENTGVVLWILVFAFGILWVLQDSGAFDAIGVTRTTNVAVVDGEPIPYDEYSRALEAQMQAYQSQTGESMSPQLVEMAREQVYNALIEDRLRRREMERLGIKVTDEELEDMVLGDNPHQIIQAYFGDGQGGINRPLLQNFAQDPAASEQWLQLEEYLRSERRNEKLSNLIAASVRVTEEDVKDEYERRTRSGSAQYVALRYASIPDDSAAVSDRELKAFYDAHEEEFERPRTVTVEYLTMSKNPTPEDTAAVVRDLEELRPTFTAATDDSVFLARNASERPYSGEYMTADQMDPEVASAVFGNLKEGAVVGPVVSGTEAHLVKIKDVRPSENAAVRAQHILFQAPEGNESARAEALRQAESTLGQIRSGGLGFEEAARRFSDDPSASRGGDLGWFGRGRMVGPFEEAAFGAQVGQIVGPVATQFGYHLIRVTDRAAQEVQIADYAQRIRADVATITKIQETLDDARYYAEESKANLLEEGGRRGISGQTVTIEEDQPFIPGIGNSRRLLNFIADAKKGDISQIIDLNEQFIVAQATDIKPAGVRSLDEVRSEIEPRARLEKKRAMLAKRLAAAQAGATSIDAVAQKVGQPVQSATNLTFGNPIVPGLGREPKFVGTLFGLGEDKVSGVVEGENAVYVVQPTQVNEAPALTEGQREQIRQQLLNQRRSAVMNRWLSNLRENADVEDNRSQFEQ